MGGPGSHENPTSAIHKALGAPFQAIGLASVQQRWLLRAAEFNVNWVHSFWDCIPGARFSPPRFVQQLGGTRHHPSTVTGVVMAPRRALKFLRHGESSWRHGGPAWASGTELLMGLWGLGFNGRYLLHDGDSKLTGSDLTGGPDSC